MSQKIYVGNLPFSTDDAALQRHFEQYGSVMSAKVIMDRDTGRSRGFGFVELDNADRALSEGSQSSIEGRQLSVSAAREQERRPAGNRPPYRR
ncbi:MAG: RNA-binding protein [Candidatus Nanoarchaeia archaeon]|nr:RNA-binding protein [Candidatus Nanoarchaeia archaeon]